jgi:hypothetical protein
MLHASLHFAAIWFSAWGTLITCSRIAREGVLAPDPLQRPGCPRCRGSMWLTLIEPDRPDHDRRTFVCAGCEHSEKIVVKYR